MPVILFTAVVVSVSDDGRRANKREDGQASVVCQRLLEVL